MVRVWLRPCVAALSALNRPGVPVHAKALVLRAAIARNDGGSSSSATSSSAFVSDRRRLFSTKGNKDKKHVEKKTIHDKVDDELDPLEIPAEVQYLSTEELKDDMDDEEDEDEYDEAAFAVEGLEAADLEDIEDEEDADISAEEWAKKFEQDVAEWDEEDVDEDHSSEDVEDDRLYIEMPGYDASLSLAEGSNIGNDGPDPVATWDQGMAVAPEMLNWMLPAEKRRPFSKGQEKPWKYFVKANHPDIVELALDVELLRLFISPTGRIRPRRFTGLTAKQQRKVAQAIKISRQLALLPYLSRYPEPSPEQWKAMEEEDIAKLTAQMADGGDEEEEEDDDVFDDDLEYD